MSHCADTDEKALAKVDSEVAARAPRWPSLTLRRLAMRVDGVIAKVDRDAIRRSKKEIKDRLPQTLRIRARHGGGIRQSVRQRAVAISRQ